jgi:hypothetical protein
VLDRFHAIVARMVFDFGETKHLKYWWHVVSESSAEPFFEAVPITDWIGRRPTPSFHRPFGHRFLLVSVTQHHPIAMVGEHGVEIVNTGEVVPKLGFADLHDQCGWRRIGISIGLKLAAAGRCFELPRIGWSSGALYVVWSHER